MNEVRDTNGLELYHYCESLCSQKVRVALAEKGLAAESHEIALCDVSPLCENLTPAYLAINPLGRVPTLVHDGTPIFESYDIIRYLDDTFPDRGERLWPEAPELRTELEEWLFEGSMRDDVSFAATFGNSIPMVTLPVLRRTIKNQPLLSFARRILRHPHRERRLLFLATRIIGASASRPMERKALDALATGLVQIDRKLAGSGGPWLLGAFSQIDVTLMACFHRLEDVSLGDALRETSLDHVGSYWERMQARPSYVEGIEQWHGGEMREAMAELFGGGNPALPALCEAIRREASC